MHPFQATKRMLPLAALVALVVAQSGLAFIQSQAARAQDAPEAVDLGAGLPDGVSLTTLALDAGGIAGSDEATTEPYLIMSLQRIPINPWTRVDGRTVFGASDFLSEEETHLLVVESGRPTVDVDGRPETYEPDQHLTVPPSVSYEIRNETGACASLLRLTVFLVSGQAGGAEASEEIPSIPASCGEPRVILSGTSDVPPPGPDLLFLTRVTWEPNARVQFPHGHPGPVGLLVESGRLNISSFSPLAGGFAAASEFNEGSWAYFPFGNPHNVVNPLDKPTTALMVGAVAADRGLFAPPHYHSRNGTYWLTFDETWQVTDEAQYGRGGETPSGELWLSNGTTNVMFQDYQFDGNAAECIDLAVDRLTGDPNVRDLELLTDDPGQPHEGDDATSARAQYGYTYADQAGTENEVGAYIECHEVRRTTAPEMVLITAYTPRRELEVQAELVDQLLDGLVLS